MKVYIVDQPVIKATGSVVAALIFHNLAFWIDAVAKAGESSKLHEGRYWVYYTLDALVATYGGCLTTGAVRTALRKLKEHGLILTGHFDAVRMHNVTWYTVSDAGWALIREGDTGEENKAAAAKAAGMEEPVTDEQVQEAVEIMESIDDKRADELHSELSSAKIGMNAVESARLIKDNGVEVVQESLMAMYASRDYRSGQVGNAAAYLRKIITQRAEQSRKNAVVTDELAKRRKARQAEESVVIHNTDAAEFDTSLLG